MRWYEPLYILDSDEHIYRISYDDWARRWIIHYRKKARMSFFRRFYKWRPLTITEAYQGVIGPERGKSRTTLGKVRERAIKRYSTPQSALEYLYRYLIQPDYGLGRRLWGQRFNPIITWNEWKTIQSSEEPI